MSYMEHAARAEELLEEATRRSLSALKAPSHEVERSLMARAQLAATLAQVHATLAVANR